MNPRGNLVLWGALLASTLVGAGCHSTPDLDAWRRGPGAGSGATPPGTVAATLVAVEDRRRSDLAGARDLALALVAAHPEDARALWAASRAESDFVLLQPAPPEEHRDLALHSARDYAGRAQERAPSDPAVLGQYAWALGATTHLEPMFSRAGHARRTEAACQAALDRDPDQREALLTLATLRLRLATLPWIARVMAIGEPEGSLDQALELARRCYLLRPDRESHLLVAKVLIAQGRTAEARTALTTALAQAPEWPRDRELEAPLREALAALPPPGEDD